MLDSFDKCKYSFIRSVKTHRTKKIVKLPKVLVQSFIHLNYVGDALMQRDHECKAALQKDSFVDISIQVKQLCRVFNRAHL